MPRAFRAFIRFGAGGERPNGFAVSWTTFRTRSPKPAIVLPENLNAYVGLTILVPEKMIALVATCHWCWLRGAARSVLATSWQA